MIKNDDDHVYRSGTMLVISIMFLVFFSVGLGALVLMATSILSVQRPVFICVGIATLMVGLTAWNMETGIEMRLEGLHFTHLIKPSYTVSYERIQRIGIRMLRGMYYCFIRYGDGILSGTFFPVDYWIRSKKEETNAFLSMLADRANLVQIDKTPLGAPIYGRVGGYLSHPD